MKKHIVLASSSSYRKALLKRLIPVFSCVSPDIDETPQPGEKAADLVARLALRKAEVGAEHCPGALIIGCDEVAEHNNDILTKPGNYQNAVIQLRKCSASTVTFFTGLTVLDSTNMNSLVTVEPFTVHFRPLSDTMIANYLRREKPYACACSLKSEGLGIALLDDMQGNDPSTLMGLPLIALTNMLLQFGHHVIETEPVNECS